MENIKNSRILEITSSYVKFVVGYVSKNVPHLIYCKKVPITGLISDGRIVNREKLIEVLKQFRNINDPVLDIRMEPNAVSLVLPSLGVKVYEDMKASGTIGDGQESGVKKVAHIDVNNVLTLIRGTQIGDGNVLIDIAPSLYVANKNGYKEPPFGVEATQLTIKAKLYTLPADILNSYTQVVQEAGFRILKSSVAVYCASQLVSVTPNAPKSYVLLDIGSNLTTMSLIGENETYNSRFIKSGGFEISKRIAQKFNIPFQIANDLKEKFGYDTSIHKFETPIFVGVNNDNNKIKIYQTDVNAVIKDYFAEFLRALKLSFDQLGFSEGQTYGSLPILITGGTSRIRGLSSIFSEEFNKRKIQLFLPNVIGARDPGFTNALGMIIVESKQKKITGSNDNYRGISNLSRE